MQKKDPDHHISVSKLAIWLPVVLTGVTLLINASLAWGRTSVHIDDKIIHLNKDDVVKGGGISYKYDLTQERSYIRKMLKDMKINCETSSIGKMSCSVDLPE